MRSTVILVLISTMCCSRAYAQMGNEDISHELYIFIHESCKISQYYMPLLDSLHDQYQGSTRFIGVFPNSSSTQEGIDSFRSKFGIEFEFLVDHEKELTRKYEATVTPEIVLVEKSSAQISYRGRIDDSYFRVGKRKTIKQTQELVELLSLVANGDKIEVAWAPAIGCFIQM